MSGPLDDVTVVEIANWVAGPSATALMADMGASVVKVEPPSGDSMRNKLRQPRFPDGVAGTDVVFQLDNRGKRSIAIDLGDERGRDIVARAHRPGRRAGHQPDPLASRALRARTRRAASPQPGPRLRARDRPGLDGGRRRQPGLRRHRLLRTRGSDRPPGGARRAPRATPGRAGRPSDRSGAPGRHPRGAARPGPDRRGPARRDRAHAGRGVERGLRHGRRTGRPAPAHQTEPRPPGLAHEHHVPLRGWSMAGGLLAQPGDLAPLLRGARAPRARCRPAVRHRSEPVRPRHRARGHLRRAVRRRALRPLGPPAPGHRGHLVEDGGALRCHRRPAGGRDGDVHRAGPPRHRAVQDLVGPVLLRALRGRGARPGARGGGAHRATCCASWTRPTSRSRSWSGPASWCDRPPATRSAAPRPTVRRG